MQHDQIASAYSYIEKRKAEILSLLQEFVEIPSCSREPEVMPAATEWVCTLLKNEGYQVRTWDVGHGNAPVIVADLKGQEEGAPVIFSGHYDTALYRELQAQNPFRIEDGKVIDKRQLSLPKTLTNIVQCKNPRCITSIEESIDHIFKLTENGEYRCVYCEERLSRSSL